MGSKISATRRRPWSSTETTRNDWLSGASLWSGSSGDGKSGSDCPAGRCLCQAGVGGRRKNWTLEGHGHPFGGWVPLQNICGASSPSQNRTAKPSAGPAMGWPLFVAQKQRSTSSALFPTPSFARCYLQQAANAAAPSQDPPPRPIPPLSSPSALPILISEPSAPRPASIIKPSDNSQNYSKTVFHISVSSQSIRLLLQAVLMPPATPIRRPPGLCIPASAAAKSSIQAVCAAAKRSNLELPAGAFTAKPRIARSSRPGHLKLRQTVPRRLRRKGPQSRAKAGKRPPYDAPGAAVAM